MQYSQFWEKKDETAKCSVSYYNDMGHFMTKIIWDDVMKPVIFLRMSNYGNFIKISKLHMVPPSP
jgi:hypothetical protein